MKGFMKSASILMMAVLLLLMMVSVVSAKSPQDGGASAATTVIVLATWQTWVIGVVASLLVALINWLAQPHTFKLWKVYSFAGVHLGRFWLTIILLPVAAGLGYWWFPVSFPSLPVLTGLTFGAGVDVIFAYGQQLVNVLMPYIGVAVFLYNLLLNYFTDADKRKQLWLDIKAWLFGQIGIPKEPDAG